MSLFRKSTGGSLVEYVIPAALVGIVVGLGMYSMYQNGTLEKFIVASMGGKIEDGMLVLASPEDAAGPANAPANTPANTPVNAPVNAAVNTPVNGPVNGPVNAPATPPAITGCDGTSCDITFGNFSLTGVPEDFASYIETNDVHSGQNMIGTLLQQIITQTEADLDMTEPVNKHMVEVLNSIAALIGDDINGTIYDPNDSGFPLPGDMLVTNQFEANICFMEYAVNGGCSSNIVNDGGTLSHFYDPAKNITYSDPPDLTMLAHQMADLKANTKNWIENDYMGSGTSLMDTFAQACSAAETTPGQYDDLLNTVTFLADYGMKINDDLANEVLVDPNDSVNPQIRSDLMSNPALWDSIRDGIASNNELFTSQLIQLAGGG